MKFNNFLVLSIFHQGRSTYVLHFFVKSSLKIPVHHFTFRYGVRKNSIIMMGPQNDAISWRKKFVPRKSKEVFYYHLFQDPWFVDYFARKVLINADFHICKSQKSIFYYWFNIYQSSVVTILFIKLCNSNPSFRKNWRRVKKEKY